MSLETSSDALPTAKRPLLQRRDFLQIIAGMTAGAGLLRLAQRQKAHAEKLPQTYGTPQKFGDGRDWFFEKRFGLFIHWGLYAIPAWHEQIQWRRHIPRAQYEKLAQQWNPTQFNPEKWLDLAQAAGMEYVCFTTKHHDGFCLWNTKQTTYNTMNTPYGRDVLKMLSDACHKRGMPLCLYYSCVDWHHPNYPNQGRHHELPKQPGDSPDLNKYLEFVKAQVRELCTNYGELGGFWWDMNVDGYQDPSINAMIRQLQPKAVINDRGYDKGDFGTPERDLVGQPFDRLTEACQSVGVDSWGYRKDEDYYSDRFLIGSIDSYLARGANYLLNVGPMADGNIPSESAAILNRIGQWYRVAKESLENTTTVTGLIADKTVLLTRKENTLYVHLNTAPLSNGVKMKPLKVAPQRATLLNNGKPARFSIDQTPNETEPYLRLRDLPVNDLTDEVLIVKLEFDAFPYGD